MVLDIASISCTVAPNSSSFLFVAINALSNLTFNAQSCWRITWIRNQHAFEALSVRHGGLFEDAGAGRDLSSGRVGRKRPRSFPRSAWNRRALEGHASNRTAVEDDA